MFRIPETFSTYGIFTLLLALLTLAAFGGLSTHRFDADDLDYLKQAAATESLSPATAFPFGRPTTELLFLLGYELWQDSPAAYHQLLVALHLVASLLLAATLRQLGIGLERALLTALLFGVNVAHFRAVHWISCLAYPSTLIFGLAALICYTRFLESGRRSFILGAAGMQAAAVGAHASSISIALFCIYLTRKRSVRQIAASVWPLFAVSVLGVGLIWAVSPRAPQIAGVSHPLDPGHLLKSLLWYSGRLVTSAHWLPTGLETPALWELGVGLFALLAALTFVLRHPSSPASGGIVWTLLALLPFLNNLQASGGGAGGPSRFLYLPSAGTSLILASLLLYAGNRIGDLLGRTWGRVASVTLLLCLLASSVSFLKRSEAISLYTSGRNDVAREDVDTGIRKWERAIAHDARLVPSDVYTRLAAAYFSLGRSPQHLLENARYPDSPRIRMLHGMTAFLHPDPQGWQGGEQQVREALQTARDSARLRHEAALAYHNLAGYHHQGRTREALDLYLRALRLRSVYPTALYNLGVIFAEQGETEKAIRVLHSAINARPDHFLALVKLGRLLHTRGQPQEAIRLFEKAIQIRPNDPDPRYNLSSALLAVGKIVAAIDTLETAVSLEPSRPDAWFALARAYEQTGLLAEATRTYRRVLALNPRHPGAASRLKILLQKKPSNRLKAP